MDIDQKGRFSKAELALIKTFSNEHLLGIRDVMLQFSDTHLDLSDEQIAILEKAFVPKLSNDVPISQQVDIYFTLPKIQEMNPALAEMHIRAKDIQRKYLMQRLMAMRNLELLDDTIVLENLKNSGHGPEERYIDMLAFVNTITYIDSRLNELKMLAQPEETEEEKKKREAQNSSK